MSRFYKLEKTNIGVCVYTRCVCMYTRRESKRKVAQRHQECVIKFWNSFWLLVL